MVEKVFVTGISRPAHLTLLQVQNSHATKCWILAEIPFARVSAALQLTKLEKIMFHQVPVPLGNRSHSRCSLIEIHVVTYQLKMLRTHLHVEAVALGMNPRGATLLTRLTCQEEPLPIAVRTGVRTTVVPRVTPRAVVQMMTVGDHPVQLM